MKITRTVLLYCLFAMLFLVALGARSMGQITKPSPLDGIQTVQLSLLGQKSLENIQLRFQLLQRDLSDLEKAEVVEHGLDPSEYHLDVQRAVLVRTIRPNGTPPSAPVPVGDFMKEHQPKPKTQ